MTTKIKLIIATLLFVSILCILLLINRGKENVNPSVTKASILEASFAPIPEETNDTVADKSEKPNEDIKVLDKDMIDKISIECQLFPTYENCSYYFNCAKKGDKAYVMYRKLSENTWHNAYTPVYSGGVYKGSIVNLVDGCEYNVKIEILSNNKVVARLNGYTKTWSNNVSAEKINLSNIIGDSKVRALLFEDIKDDNWSAIDFDVNVDVDDSSRRAYKITKNNGKYVASSMDMSKVTNCAVLVNGCANMILNGGYVKGGYINGIRVYKSDNIRFSNVEILGYGRLPKYKNAYGQGYGADNKRVNYDSGFLIEASGRVTLENSYIHSPRYSANAWDDNFSSDAHPVGPNAVYIKETKGNNVIRYNDFTGSDEHRFNDVIESWNNGAANGGPYRDSDFYGNLYAYCNDDGMELDGGQMNIRVYNNKFTGSLAGISIAPNLIGPSYIFRNVITNLSDVRGKTNFIIKTCGMECSNPGYTMIFNNTFASMKSIVYCVSKENQRAANVISRNNIMLNEGHAVISNRADTRANDYDYDLLYSRNGGQIFGFKINQEKNCTIAEPSFVNEEAAVFTQKKGSKAIDGKSEKLDNFTDNYCGKSPDFGAFEYGKNYSYLERPSGLYADAYYVNLSGKTTYSFKIKSQNGDNQKLYVKKSLQEKWFDVTLSKDSISKDEEVICTVKKKDGKNVNSHGVFLVRTESGNGISVCVEK